MHPLRPHAEAIRAQSAPLLSPAELAQLTPEATQQLLHELQVHQIELEMQNEELRQTQLALDAARSRYVDLYDLAPVGYCSLSATGQVLQANLSAAGLLGLPRAGLVQQYLTRFIHADDQDAYYQLQRRVLGSDSGQGKAPSLQLRLRRSDASTVWVQLDVSLTHDAQDAPVLRVVMSDVSAAQEARQRLADQGATLAAVIDSASDAVISVDRQGQITLFNPAAEQIFGRAAAAMLGQALTRLLPEPLPRWTDGSLRLQGRHASGQVLELEVSVSRLPAHAGAQQTLIARDVTARVRTERALMQYQFELSELTQRLMAQEKATTRKLAQTLHDRLGQTLTALRLSFDALAGQLSGSPATSGSRWQTLDGLIEQAMQELRQALTELRPPLLEDQGLPAALDNEVRSRELDAAPVQLTLQVPSPLQAQRWPAEVEHAAFMVAREALSNALQHAAASRIQLRLDGHASALQLEVCDNGRGMPAPLAGGDSRPGHLGLVGMRERALAIGAELSALPASGGGVCIRLVWRAEP